MQPLLKSTNFTLYTSMYRERYYVCIYTPFLKNLS